MDITASPPLCINLHEWVFSKILKTVTLQHKNFSTKNQISAKHLKRFWIPCFPVLKSAHCITTTKVIVLNFHLPLIVLGISLANHPLSRCHEIIPGLWQWLLTGYPQSRKHHPLLGWHRKTIENPVFHFRNPNITLLSYHYWRYLVSNIDNNSEGGPTNVLFMFNQSSSEQHNIWKKFMKYGLLLFHVNFSSSG